MALARAGVTGDNHPLPAAGEAECCQIHDLSFVQSGLEVEVEINQELTFRQFCFLDTPLYLAFAEGIGLQGKQPFKQFGARSRFSDRSG